MFQVAVLMSEGLNFGAELGAGRAWGKGEGSKAGRGGRGGRGNSGDDGCVNRNHSHSLGWPWAGTDGVRN